MLNLAFFKNVFLDTIFDLILIFFKNKKGNLNHSKHIPVGLFDADKVVYAVFLYVFRMAFTASILKKYIYIYINMKIPHL